MAISRGRRGDNGVGVPRYKPRFQHTKAVQEGAGKRRGLVHEAKELAWPEGSAEPMKSFKQRGAQTTQILYKDHWL